MVLVETSEEDSFLIVAQHVAELLTGGDEQKSALVESQASMFLDECTTLVADNKLDLYITKVLEHLELVFSKSSDKDCESIANILVHATMRLPEDKAPASIAALSAALTFKLDDRAEERLSALLNLYGSSASQSVSLQLSLLLSCCAYACRHPRLATVSKLSAAEYLKLATAALALGKPEDTAAMEKLQPHAVATVVDFIRNPSTYQCDLAELPVMKHLAKDKQYEGLMKLLNIILVAGITAEQALYKARMVALLSLGGQAAHEELSFAEVEKALDIPADQVEIWLVRAIGSKLIEGKIDQLAAWKENLEAVQVNMASGKAGIGSACRGAEAIKAELGIDGACGGAQAIKAELGIGSACRGAEAIKAELGIDGACGGAQASKAELGIDGACRGTQAIKAELGTESACRPLKRGGS
eukprot:gene11889-14993_t